MSRSISEIKDSLQRVCQTRKITNALRLLSSARLRSDRALSEYRALYAERLTAAMGAVLASKQAKTLNSAFLDGKTAAKPLFLVVAGDKGLCGSYNAEVIRFAGKLIGKRRENGAQPLVFGFGKACAAKSAAAGLAVEKALPGAASHPDAHTARQITETLLEKYLSGEADEINIVCTPFETGAGKPVCVRLLPLRREDFPGADDEEVIFEPDINAVFESVALAYIGGRVYSLLLLSAMSENAARMTAMQDATDRADEKAEALEKSMNEQRQLGITNELTEIAATAEAQKLNK